MTGTRVMVWVAAGVAGVTGACSVDERQVDAPGDTQSVQFSAPSSGGSSNLDATASGSLEPGAADPDRAPSTSGGACVLGTHRCGAECVSNDSPATCGEVSCEPCPTPTGGFATCDGALCGGQCPFGSKLCDGACIALLSGCVGACPAGSHDCDGTCVPDSSIDTCGLRCAPCAAPDGSQPLCSNGVCTFTCSPGFRDCNGLCLEPTSTRGCGPSCSICPAFANATTTCDGTSCDVQCDAANFFLDQTGCHPGATQVAASPTVRGHGCAVLFDGTMRCWGNNFSGQLGIGTDGSFHLQPVDPEIDGVVAIGLGMDFTCALRSDGSVWCWGDNIAGQLGRGNTDVTDAAFTPVPVVGVNDALELSVGAFHACVTRPSGLYCWGANGAGELGAGLSALIVSEPARVNIEAVNQISTGTRSTCVQLSGSGAVRCWGESLLTEFAPDAGDAVRSVVTSGSAGCVLLQSNSVRCWGPSVGSSAVPVAGLGAVQSIAVSADLSCVVSPAGLASCWGANDAGQLGRGTTSPAAVESAPVGGLDQVRQLAVGDDRACALRTDGSVLCWGANLYGQLGTYRVQSSAVPISVEPW